MEFIRTITAADWGLALQRAARIAAPIAVLVFVIAADLVALTYRAGMATGAALARRADQLAALFVQLLAPRPVTASLQAPATAAPVARPQLAKPRPSQPHCIAPRGERDRLEAMTQRQLMALAGTRRKLSKRQLIAQLAAA